MSDEQFTEEAMKAQDGKKVPLTLEPGGPVIGEATLHYEPGDGELRARCMIAKIHVTNPRVAEFLKEDEPSVIFRQDR